MKRLSLITLVFTPFLSVSAFSAESININVTGKLTVGACTPLLSGGSSIDYGPINVNDLNPNSQNNLNLKNTNLIINCSSRQKVAISATDDRHDSEDLSISLTYSKDQRIVADDAKYGLSFDDENDTVLIGSYAIIFNGSPQYDGVTGSLLEGTANGDFMLQTAVDLLHERGECDYGLVTVGTAGSNEPVAFKNVIFPIQITTALESASELRLVENALIDGEATFSLVYL